MNLVPRTLRATLDRALRTFPAAVVTGPRQSGKTTLLTEGWGNTHGFISLENPETRARAISDPGGLFRAFAPPLILDEIQYAPELLHYVKTAIDANREQAGQWLISGSQGFPLMHGVAQSLAGRAAVVSLLPLSWLEAAGAAGEAEDMTKVLAGLFDDLPRSPARKVAGLPLGEWILTGGYPEPCLRSGVDRRLWFGSYVQTYLERDVRMVTNVGDLRTYAVFLRLCAMRTGQILNLSDIARDAGISVPTAKRWVSILEASGQVFLLPPFFANLGKRLVKSPKLYFLDTGLASFLCGLHDAEAAMQGPMGGALVETAVVSAWVKAFCNRGEPPALFFYRSHDGLEVDLIVDMGGRLHPMEIKATATPLPGHAAPLEKWMGLAGSRSADRGILFAEVEAPVPLTPRVSAVPWSWAG